MICAALTAVTNAAVREQLAIAAGEPADLHGIRLDTFREPPDPESFVDLSTRPILVSCLGKKDGGEFEGGDETRRELLIRAAAAGAAYIEAGPDDIAAIAPKKHGAILIAALRDSQKAPLDLEQRLHTLARSPADWISFAVAVRHPAVNLLIFESIASSPKPCVGLGLGPEGVMTRVLGPALGSKITYGYLARDPEETESPSVKELATLYRVREITSETQVYGIVGNPVAHFSCIELFNRGFQALELDAVFLPFHTENAEYFLSTIPHGIDIQGLTVAPPHKLPALAWAESASEAARRIGAANTLTLREDGWRADNTECLSLFEAVRQTTDLAGITLTNRPALVLGSGAAARAIGIAFTLLGCRVTVAGRPEDRAKRLAADMNWEVEAWGEAAHGPWQAVGNGTPIGSAPDVEATPFPGHSWRPGMFAFDTAYPPRETRFMRDARAAGAYVMALEEMLERQTAAQFRMWTGFDLPAEAWV